MKSKWWLMLCVLVWSLTSMAIPAKRGVWKVITLDDGSQVVAELMGDEHGSFYRDRQGNIYGPTENNRYAVMSVHEALNGKKGSVREKILKEAREAETTRQRKVSALNTGTIPTNKEKFQGFKKGLVMLVQFADCPFDNSNCEYFNCSSVNQLYDKIINERNLNMPPFQGSVKDYFIDQSDGVFTLEFDVVGPITLSHNADYYGAKVFNKTTTTNSETNEMTVTYSDGGSDCHVGSMVYDALKSIRDGDIKKSNGNSVNFSDYDWDKDGNAEVVYVIYAGQGEADGGQDWRIWPHKWGLTSAKNWESTRSDGNYYYLDANDEYQPFTTDFGEGDGTLTYDGTKINIYACSNELATNGEAVDGVYRTQITGIGTMCHEFSHTMGYPDMYDVNYQYAGNEMGHWDLMCSGSYNGRWNGGNSEWRNIRGGYCPASYTAFEKWCAGWLDPIELTDPQKITGMKPLGGTTNGPADHGPAYVVYMPGSDHNIKGEYYMLENRERLNWDKALPWAGLLINYVHYDETLWGNNKLNTTSSSNSHQRMTVFQAGGKDNVHYLELDAYPYEVECLHRIFSKSAPFYDEDASTMAAKLNTWLNEDFLKDVRGHDYSGTVNILTADNNALDDQSNPKAYYWGSNSEAQTLTGQEIWNIEYNGDANRTVNFIYRKPTENELNLDQDVNTEQTINAGLYTQVTTNKPLKKDIYNTLWLPFDMNYADVQQWLGNGTRVYRFTSVDTEDGKTVLDFTDDTRNGIKAYTPVLVKLADDATQDITINISGGDNGRSPYMQVNTALTDANPVVTTESGWQFVGTKTYDFVPAGAFYLNNNLYYQASGSKAKLRAYRAYFVAPEPAQNSNANTIFNQFSGDETAGQTGEEEYEIQSADDPESLLYDPTQLLTRIDGQLVEITRARGGDGIYSLSGQLISTAADAESLPKGIYIIGGRKMVVK